MHYTPERESKGVNKSCELKNSTPVNATLANPEYICAFSISRIANFSLILTLMVGIIIAEKM